MPRSELTEQRVPGKADSLAALLKMRLSGASHPLGSRFPSAQELAQGYGVSIGTARKAMGSLVESGHLRAERGAGHFVTLKPPPLQQAAGSGGAGQQNSQPKFLVVLEEDSLDTKYQRLLGNYMRGMMSACDAAGFDLELIRNDPDKLRERLSCGGIVGILCYYLRRPISIDLGDLPVVAFGHLQVHPRQVTIVADVESGVYEAYRHLFSLGHESVVMLVTDIKDFQSQGAGEYLLGMRKAFAEYGVSWSKDLVVGVTQQELESNGDFLKTKIASGVTGMFVPKWPGVLGVYRQARGTGIQIGQDISVVAFGNHPWADLLEPDITRVAWEPARHSERAVALIDEMVGEADKRSRMIHMPVHLLTGGSCNSLLLDGVKPPVIIKSASSSVGGAKLNPDSPSAVRGSTSS